MLRQCARGPLCLAVLLALAVAWPGTPPGNFVRDASTGEITKAGAALCSSARLPRPSLASPAGDPVVVVLPPQPRVALGTATFSLVACDGPPSPRACLASSPVLARAPPTC